MATSPGSLKVFSIYIKFHFRVDQKYCNSYQTDEFVYNDEILRFFSLIPESSPDTEESGSSHTSDHGSEDNPEAANINQNSSTTSSSSASSSSSELIIDQIPLVLLIYWPQNVGFDNLSEVNRMEAVFRNHYRYNIRVLVIDQRNHFNSVNKVPLGFQRELRSSDQLLIVYYIGHGNLGDTMRFEISPHAVENQNPMTLVKLDWSTIQVISQNIDCDVLMLLDTCLAASTIAASQSTNSNSRSRTEIIAAGGYETTTPGPCRSPIGNSPAFSRALAAELYRLSGSLTPFSAALLYRGILETTIVDTTTRRAMMGEFHDTLVKSPTPVHVVLGNSWRPSIPLWPSGGLGLLALEFDRCFIHAGCAEHLGSKAEAPAKDAENTDFVRDDPRGTRPSTYMISLLPNLKKSF
ncbi:hypothetical protein BKA64DRAFT_769860 [Cadophora sp. MPI-SDFR-AT-0126]|nr:hypothetical protein BKA64DRAFT_769860 [Leotiomycetes sp. MPI-SDFR-AT-0126]